MAKPEVCNEKAITEGDLHGFFIVTGTYVNSNHFILITNNSPLSILLKS
ncbi:MAG: hypothetical protein ACI4EI_00975 [Muricoprocola sp.]